MNLELTETQTLIRDTARKFARERVAPQARTLDREERFPTELYKEMGELGLLGVNIPAKHGGSEAGVVSYALAMMEMAAADAPLRTSMLSMSLGLMSAMRLTWLSCVGDGLEPVTESVTV